MIHLSTREARRFVLWHQGLLGPHRFTGRQGILAYLQQAGCLQFDPVNVCGRSPDLALLSRIDGYVPEDLSALLYEKRSLVDHFDKNLAIYPISDWPFLQRNRRAWADTSRSRQVTVEHREMVLNRIKNDGPQSAASLGLAGQVDWYWARSSLARATLEQLYLEGLLLVHSKQGVIKTYDLAERCLPAHILSQPEPFLAPEDQAAWHLLRRVRALGLMWNQASDAWLGSLNWYAPMRRQSLERLLAQKRLLPISVEGIKKTLYITAPDADALAAFLAADQAQEPRCELLAPLDSFLWDRRLTRALFDFEYTWEIYTPAHKRVYGSYVLPILYGDRLVGRIEPVCDRKAAVLRVRGLWWESGFAPDAQVLKALKQALNRLARMNGCQAALPNSLSL